MTGALLVRGVHRGVFKVITKDEPEEPWRLARDGAGGFFRTCTLGAPGAWRYAITWAMDSDVPWSIEARGGELLAPLETPPAAFDELAGPGASGDLAALFAVLPASEYLVISLRPDAIDRPGVLLGNEWVPDPPEHLETLVDDGVDVALAVGHGRPPDRTRPLLGVPVFDYTGNRRPSAVLCFEVMKPATANADLEHPLVVVAKHAPLVLDPSEDVSGHDTVAVQRAWSERGAIEAARRLAGLV